MAIFTNERDRTSVPWLTQYLQLYVPSEDMRTWDRDLPPSYNTTAGELNEWLQDVVYKDVRADERTRFFLSTDFARIRRELQNLHGALHRIGRQAALGEDPPEQSDIDALNEALGHYTPHRRVFAMKRRGWVIAPEIPPTPENGYNAVAVELVAQFWDAVERNAFRVCPVCGGIFVRVMDLQRLCSRRCSDREKMRLRRAKEKSENIICSATP